MLARRQSNIQPGLVGQDAQPCLDGKWIGSDVDSIHSDGAALGLEQAIDHPQRSGLAGAVRAEQSGDLPVRRVERHAIDGQYRSKTFAKVFYTDHFPAPPIASGPA